MHTANNVYKKMAVKRILIVFSILIGIIAVEVYSSYVNSKEIEKQITQNLEDVAKQNAAILEAKIFSQYQLITALAEELDGVTEDTIDDKLNHFKIFIDDYNVKRFAFSFPGGPTYSTDGEETNLVYRKFFQKGMQGKCYITGVLQDAILGDYTNVNVMTVPVIDDGGNINGVFGLAYDTDMLDETLRIKSFDGESYCCIINEDAEIISTISNDDVKISQNLLADVLKEDCDVDDSICKLSTYIENKASGGGVIYLPDKNYYHIVPVSLMDGSFTWYILTIVPSKILMKRAYPIQKSQVTSVVLVIIMILIGALLILSFLKEQQKRMVKFAYEDLITKGSNYTKFHLDMQDRADYKGYLIDMDIVNFNNISIVAGKAAAEKMIRETWKSISRVIGKDELAAHVKDDLFIMFMAEENGDKLLERLEKISAAIYKNAKEIAVYGIHARYGIYKMAADEPLENAYSKVKLAREYAISNTETNYVFYNEINRIKMQYEKQLEDDFPQALANNEFEVWYQPKYDAEDCSIVGSEALVRWRKSDGEMVSPGEFIPIFEGNGTIVKLDEYMFRAVCKQQRIWLDEGKKIYPVSINISRATLYCMDIHKRYSAIINEYDIDPKYIQLEITETVIKGGKDIYELLNKFRDMGIKILMDDFGTGYSSLATLSMQCFDTLKIDKTLIDHIGSKNGETMLYHIILMGKQMGLHITAEGVEEKNQLEFLQDLKCDDIQGFYFSRPLPKNEYENLISN